MAAPTPAEIAQAIHALLDQRAGDKTICPSDAARALRPDGDWRALMDDVRATAAEEARAGRLEIRQRGETIEPGTPIKGPIRLGRPRRDSA